MITWSKFVTDSLGATFWRCGDANRGKRGSVLVKQTTAIRAWLAQSHISDVAPPVINCASPLGLEDGQIPNSAFKATSVYGSTWGPELARLRNKNRSPNGNCWLSKYNDVGQWLQIDLGKTTKVTRIATQGRDDANQWVSTYTISSSMDAKNRFVPFDGGRVGIILFYRVQSGRFWWAALPISRSRRHLGCGNEVEWGGEGKKLPPPLPCSLQIHLRRYILLIPGSFNFHSSRWRVESLLSFTA